MTGEPKVKNSIKLSLAGLLISIATIAVAAEDANKITALVGAQIIDGLSKQAIENRAVLVQNDRIVAISELDAIPADAKRINLNGATLLPGLIDSHAHPLISGDDYQSLHLKQSSAYKALKAYKGMQRLLDAGWTTLRVAGDADVYYGNQDIRKLIDEGVLTGPRIFGAAHYLSITGGGGDINYFSHQSNALLQMD